MQDALVAYVFPSNSAGEGSAKVFFYFEVGKGIDDVVHGGQVFPSGFVPGDGAVTG
jgi:hypothetical protein